MLFNRPRFSIMALFAKRLPITLVPKQNLISPVRSDMINNSCRSQFIDPFALYTKGVLCQKPLTRILPPTVITTFKGVLSIVNMQFCMKFAITTTRQSRAPRMLARSLRFFRHNRLLLSYVRMRERMKNASGQRKKPGDQLQTCMLFWQL